MKNKLALVEVSP